MLVITRRVGESFFIGDEIEVFVLGSGAQVRLGISAPKDCEIMRTELIRDELELTTSAAPRASDPPQSVP